MNESAERAANLTVSHRISSPMKPASPNLTSDTSASIHRPSCRQGLHRLACINTSTIFSPIEHKKYQPIYRTKRNIYESFRKRWYLCPFPCRSAFWLGCSHKVSSISPRAISCPPRIPSKSRNLRLDCGQMRLS